MQPQALTLACCDLVGGVMVGWSVPSRFRPTSLPGSEPSLPPLRRPTLLASAATVAAVSSPGTSAPGAVLYATSGPGSSYRCPKTLVCCGCVCDRGGEGPAMDVPGCPAGRSVGNLVPAAAPLAPLALLPVMSQDRLGSWEVGWGDPMSDRRPLLCGSGDGGLTSSLRAITCKVRAAVDSR